MTVIERSLVVEVLVAAQGESHRKWYESDDRYARAAVDRAMEAAAPFAEQLAGAVSAGAAMYAALLNGDSLGDKSVDEAMLLWEAHIATAGGQSG